MYRDQCEPNQPSTSYLPSALKLLLDLHHLDHHIKSTIYDQDFTACFCMAIVHQPHDAMSSCMTAISSDAPLVLKGHKLWHMLLVATSSYMLRPWALTCCSSWPWALMHHSSCPQALMHHSSWPQLWCFMVHACELWCIMVHGCEHSSWLWVSNMSLLMAISSDAAQPMGEALMHQSSWPWAAAHCCELWCVMALLKIRGKQLGSALLEQNNKVVTVW